MSPIPNPRAFLEQLFYRAVEVADPMRCVPAALPEKPSGRVIVIGAGKASARMAAAVESAWGPCEGLVITRYGYASRCERIEIVEAAHPVPDTNGLLATRRMLDLVSGLREDDFVLALISGGGSALLVQPAGDISLEEKQRLNGALLDCGATISEINVVRKHLSRVKGGQLAAAAWPARMLTLAISDIPGDDPALIASGPTVGDASRAEDAAAILNRYGIETPASIRAVLHAGNQALPLGSPKLSRSELTIVAAPSQSLQAAALQAADAGCAVRILGDSLEGEARSVAREQARLARDIRASLRPGDRPVVLLSGGECTVTRTGDGIGGPNAEFALALACELAGAPGVWAIACDTDGVDGAAEVAGAVISPATIAKARERGVDPHAALARNDSHTFFAALGDQIVSGPTLTNVNDFRAIFIAGV